MSSLSMLCTLYIVAGLIAGFSQAELYTSVEELSYWTSSRNRIVELVDQKLAAYTVRLEKLKQLRQVLARALELELNTNYSDVPMDTPATIVRKPVNFAESQLLHPVSAFIMLNRIANDLDEARYLLEEDGTPYGMTTDFEKLVEEGNLPSDDDVIGSGEALLRLQEFYNLETIALAEGKIVLDGRRIDNDISGGLKMNFDDIFLLGKIATDNEQYKLGLEWFELALKEANQEDGEGEENLDNIEADKYNYLLEYMAYAAYKDNRMEYAAALTKMWAASDPENQKAIDNLRYFDQSLDELSKSGEHIRMYDLLRMSQINATRSLDEAEDDRARLCRNSEQSPSNRDKCLRITAHWTEILGMKIEVLNDSPRIIRLYDILSDKEAEQLRENALPVLKRSTVGHGYSFKVSKSRIAKSAWFSVDGNSLAKELRSRLSSFLDIDLTTSEDLQVVNYGLGGFYDLHLDAFGHEHNKSADSDLKDQTPLEMRLNNNRLATILIYLDDVKAGGATIFTELNLHVKPVKGSAIIWYNLHKNRTTDDRTIHMGCPVLLGSKWIATIWARENGNTFLRPCGLSKSE